jgi:hypothetical protein
MKKSTPPVIACVALLVAQSFAGDTMPYCGHAVITLEEGRAASLGWVDAHFSDARTRGQVLLTFPRLTYQSL